MTLAGRPLRLFTRTPPRTNLPGLGTAVAPLGLLRARVGFRRLRGESVESHPAPATSTVESDAGLRAVEIASGLDRPVYVAAAPGEPDRLYVVGQAGVVQVLERGKLREEPFLDISTLTTTSPKDAFASEQGLLSMAFAPDYATSGRFYVDYTDRDGDVNVVEYRARAGRADPVSAHRLLLVEKSQAIHNGGQLQVGRTAASTSASATTTAAPTTRRASRPETCSERSCAWTRPALASSPTACGTRGASPSTKRPGTSGSPTSARSAGRRSAGFPAPSRGR